MKKVIEFLPYIIAGYETLSHAIPTKKNYSLFNKIGVVLQLLSGFLNRNKPYGGKKSLPLLLIAFCFPVFIFFGCSTLKKIDCVSTKRINITFVTKEGRVYTVAVPFCDTIRIKSETELPDTTKPLQ